ncbi:hypothetical protein QEZ54_03240 [Catellatospora sp. KI3]|uniref:hypothetical protein n=1 Tax=Catellatospora sp. KI3 TaxID=3041620 RepID=UPI0024827195|nr:hypothetical protein [Catellatospora sp. KI3]MDI1459974.1 hypothetical protein [Catellatospora sp. KI3]
MPKPPLRPDELTRRIFRGADAVRSGLLTPAQLRSTAWQPLFRGVYADRALTITHRLRCLAVVDFLLPEDGVIAGRSAASLYGAPYEAEGPVEVLTAGRFGPMAGLLVHRGAVPDKDITRRTDGIRVTTPQRTCWDLARWLDLPDAVALMDVLTTRRVVSSGALVEYANARIGTPGWNRLLKAAKLTDPASRSPLESRLRVRLALANLPAPVLHYVVETGDGPAPSLELAWPQQRVGIVCEPDEAQRRPRVPVPDDAGWTVLTVTAARLAEEFDELVAELRAALRGRRR